MWEQYFGGKRGSARRWQPARLLPQPLGYGATRERIQELEGTVKLKHIG